MFDAAAVFVFLVVEGVVLCSSGFFVGQRCCVGTGLHRAGADVVLAPTPWLMLSSRARSSSGIPSVEHHRVGVRVHLAGTMLFAAPPSVGFRAGGWGGSAWQQRALSVLAFPSGKLLLSLP